MATYVQVVPAMGDAQVRLGQIQRGHLSYLHLDEGSEKLTVRRELEALVGDHLCSVPHREKFTCPKFGDVLRRTIDERPDFKATGAVQAFDALERYALNLIAQPWRQEYFSVRLYSGFFKHCVDYYLSNVEDILYLMGYEPADGMELRLTEPVDPDRVTDIALNCLIAAVECQIMMQILEKVGGSFSWKEIARVRRHCVGGPDNAADILVRGGGKLSKDRKSAATTTDGFQHGGRGGRRSNGYVRVEKLVDVPGMWTDDVTMESDERYPVCESGWERKSVSNGGGFHQQQRRPIQATSFEDDYDGALSLMQEDRRRSLQMMDDSSPQTRAGTWGFVDQSLERKGYNKDYGERGDLLKTGATNTATSAKNRSPLPDPITAIDYSPLMSSEYRNSQSFNYPSQKKPKMTQALTYGRLPAYAKSSPLYGTTSRAISTPIEPTVDDLIELDNPSSNLGFHPGMFTDSQLLRAKTFNPTPLPLLPPAPPAQHYHPVYAALLHSTASQHHLNATLPSNFYSSMERQRNMDLLAAVPPPPVKHSIPRDIIDAISNLQLSEDGMLPPPVTQVGSTRDRRSKKSQASADHRRSTYDNLQDNIDVSTLPSPATSSSANNPMSPPSPTPPLLTSSKTPEKSVEKRFVNGGMAIRDSPQTPTSSSLVAHRNYIKATDKASSGSRDQRDLDSDRLEVPMTNSNSRRSSQSSSSTATTPRDQRGSSGGRESSEKSRISSSLSVTRPRHERSASVGSSRSSSAGAATKSCESSSWECWACTYLNIAGRDVCEMCSRSRCKGAESDPLSSGGHECQNCTLVNDKGARKCSACNSNLENSPTYV